MAKEPVLELSTLAPDRPRIKIDDELYEIAVPADFGLLETFRLDELRKPMQAYRSNGKPRSETNVIEMVAALKEFTGMVLRGADASVLDKLTEGHQVQIIQVFMNAAGWMEPGQVTTTERAPRTRRTTGT